LALLKAQFCFERFIGPKIDRVKILALLDEKKLDFIIFLFKITMYSNHVDALEPPLVCNLIIQLWSKLAFIGLLQYQLIEYFTLVKLTMVMILGNVKDECCFFTLSFMKSKLQPTNNSFGFNCENVCTRELLFGYLSFWGKPHEGLGRE
jgi:hypothetical protein